MQRAGAGQDGVDAHLFPVLIDVEAGAALAPQEAGSDHLPQGHGGMIFGADLLVQHHHHVQQNVQADHISQLQRTHGVVAAQLHAVVHILHGADVGPNDDTGLVEHGQQGTVHDKPRRVLSEQREKQTTSEFCELYLYVKSPAHSFSPWIITHIYQAIHFQCFKAPRQPRVYAT